MQVAGKNCSNCGTRIVSKQEGTWCARCGGVLCRDCAIPGAICGTCNQGWDDPEKYFVFSRMCPACLGEVDHADNCPLCGEPTKWENRDLYDEFRRNLDSAVATAKSTGMAMIVAGIACVVGPTALFLYLLNGNHDIVFWWYGAYAISIYLFFGAYDRFKLAQALKNFE